MPKSMPLKSSFVAAAHNTVPCFFFSALCFYPRICSFDVHEVGQYLSLLMDDQSIPKALVAWRADFHTHCVTHISPGVHSCNRNMERRRALEVASHGPRGFACCFLYKQVFGYRSLLCNWVAYGSHLTSSSRLIVTHLIKEKSYFSFPS